MHQVISAGAGKPKRGRVRPLPPGEFPFRPFLVAEGFGFVEYGLAEFPDFPWIPIWAMIEIPGRRTRGAT